MKNASIIAGIQAIAAWLIVGLSILSEQSDLFIIYGIAASCGFTGLFLHLGKLSRETHQQQPDPNLLQLTPEQMDFLESIEDLCHSSDGHGLCGYPDPDESQLAAMKQLGVMGVIGWERMEDGDIWVWVREEYQTKDESSSNGYVLSGVTLKMA